MKLKLVLCLFAASAATCAALGSGALASAEETLPSWTYYETNTVGSAHPGISYITDGTWKLRATPYRNSATELLITTGGTGTNAFWTGLPTTTDTLDLRGLITSPDGSKTNTITHIDQFSLGADGQKEPSTPKRFIAPTTLNCGLYGWFNGFRIDGEECVAAYTNITIHVPGWFETINVNQRPRTDGNLDWDLYLPGLRKICSWSLLMTGKGVACNEQTYGVLTAGAFKELRTVQSQVFPNKAKFSGVLDLPSLTWADAWSMNGSSPGFVEAKIAAEKACCAYLGTGCIGWNYNMTNVVLGLCATNKIAGQICSGITAIKRVTFTGYPPNFTSTANDCFTMGEKKATFVIPSTLVWNAFLAKNASAITWMSAEEIRTAANANPNEPVRMATVGPSVFRSSNTQYLAYPRTSLSTSLDYDTAFGDTVEVDYLPDDQGLYPAGVDLTLTAKPNTARGGAFAGWYGDVPGGKCTDASITLRLSPKPNGLMPHVYARFTHPWSLVEVEGTSAILSNGIFRINATVDSASLTVRIAKGKVCSLYADDNTGTGVLDFGGPVTDAAGNAYTITGMNGGATGCFSLPTSNAYGARVFVSPGTIKTWDGAQLFHATGRKATYETIIIDEPTASGTVVSGWVYSDQNKLKYIILRGENLVFNTSMSSGALAGPFYNSQVKNTDLGWWYLPNTSVGAGQIMHNANQRMYGTLSLDNAKFVGASAFSWDNNLNDLRLGFGKKSSRVTSLGEAAFKGCSGLTNIVLNAAATLTVGTDCFWGASGVKTVTFLGPAVSEAAFAGLLAGVTAAEAKPAIVYVSSMRGDWQKATYIDWNVGEEEKASAPAGERVLGVYRGGAASPKGKAWVCDKASPFDPKGFQIIVK